MRMGRGSFRERRWEENLYCYCQLLVRTVLYSTSPVAANPAFAPQTTAN